MDAQGKLKDCLKINKKTQKKPEEKSKKEKELIDKS